VYRKAFPARGPKAKGWGEFLARQGIEQSTALNYMKLAGYVEVSASADGDAEIPTQRQVNAARKSSAERDEDRMVVASRDTAPDPADVVPFDSV
jgi:hypothetical protein